MRILFSIALVALLIGGCSNRSTESSNTVLSPSAFAEKLKAILSPTIIDVRTPAEFAKGHVNNALNYDWRGNEFDAQIVSLDKSKPVFIYCLSGGRSSAAADKMRAEGFKEVYEMQGGLMKWRAANLPETKGAEVSPDGLSKQQFDALLETNKLVLIDFYADWCAPCKKMKPYINEISKEMADNVLVISINTDENQALCKELNIDAIPVLQIYKAKSLVWSNTGFIEKEAVVKQLQ
jgi:thioredoxin